MLEETILTNFHSLYTTLDLRAFKIFKTENSIGTWNFQVKVTSLHSNFIISSFNLFSSPTTFDLIKSNFFRSSRNLEILIFMASTKNLLKMFVRENYFHGFFYLPATSHMCHWSGEQIAQKVIWDVSVRGNWSLMVLLLFPLSRTWLCSKILLFVKSLKM